VRLPGLSLLTAMTETVSAYMIKSGARPAISAGKFSLNNYLLTDVFFLQIIFATSFLDTRLVPQLNSSIK
jgi:hypothetical protein